MPVEQMSNEQRMTIKVMAQSAEGGPNQEGGSPRQKTMEEIILKQQKMFAMSQQQQ